MDVPTLLAEGYRSVVSSGVRSANRATTLREHYEHVPGDHRLEFTPPSVLGARRRPASPARRSVPTCARSPSRTTTVHGRGSHDVASALEDAAEARARRHRSRGAGGAERHAERMSTPGRCGRSRAGIRISPSLLNPTPSLECVRPCSTLTSLEAPRSTLALLALAVRARGPRRRTRTASARPEPRARIPSTRRTPSSADREVRVGVTFGRSATVGGPDSNAGAWRSIPRLRRLSPRRSRGARAAHGRGVVRAPVCRWCKSAAVPSACDNAESRGVDAGGGVFANCSHRDGEVSSPTATCSRARARFRT